MFDSIACPKLPLPSRFQQLETQHEANFGSCLTTRLRLLHVPKTKRLLLRKHQMAL